MKLILAIVILVGGVVGVTGCGKGTVPVSSTSVSTSNKDSVSEKTQVKKDSSTYTEQVTEKILPGSTVGITLTRSQLDSLIRSLQAMPSSVIRTIVQNDPTLRTTLKLAMDSLGRIRLECITASQVYYEKLIKAERVITDLQSENTRLKSQATDSKTEVDQPKPGFWQALKAGLSQFVWFGIIIVALIVIGLLIELKRKILP